MEDFYHQLQEILKKHTWEEAAEKLGVSVKTIANYVSENNKPYPKTVRRIEEVYNELYGAKKDPEPKTQDHTDKLIVSLEGQATDKQKEIDRLQKVISETLSSFEKAIDQLTKNQRALLALTESFQEYWMDWVSEGNPGKAQQAKAKVAAMYLERLKTIQQQDTVASSH